MGEKLIVLSIMYLALAGCVRDVVLDAGEKPQVVVECVLTASSPQELRLSFTKGASLAAAPELTEATARLTDLTDDYPAGEFRRLVGVVLQDLPGLALPPFLQLLAPVP